MKLYLCAAAITGLLLSGSAAMAQGTTSGPASGSPTTLGTGGQTGATPHQGESLKGGGGAAMQKEQQGQAGGATGDTGAAKTGTTPAKPR